MYRVQQKLTARKQSYTLVGAEVRAAAGLDPALADLVDIEGKVFGAKVAFVNKSKRVVAEKVREGLLPKEKKDYLLTLNQKGRTQTRDIDTIRPQFIHIGTRQQPTYIRAVTKSDNYEDVIDAVVAAWKALGRRVPIWTGQYAASFDIMINDTVVSSTLRVSNIKTLLLQKLRIVELKPGAVVRIVNTAPYASAIELGFYRNYYRGSRRSQRRGNKVVPRPGGIMRYVADLVMRTFDSDVAVRFSYYYGGKSEDGGTGYAQPAIEFGTRGQFSSRLTEPRRGRRNFAAKRGRGRRRRQNG